MNAAVRASALTAAVPAVDGPAWCHSATSRVDPSGRRKLRCAKSAPESMIPTTTPAPPAASERGGSAARSGLDFRHRGAQHRPQRLRQLHAAHPVRLADRLDSAEWHPGSHQPAAVDLTDHRAQPHIPPSGELVNVVDQDKNPDLTLVARRRGHGSDTALPSVDRTLQPRIHL